MTGAQTCLPTCAGTHCIYPCPTFVYPCHWLTDSLTHSLTESLTHRGFTFWHERAILETCDLWDIWSEWWRYMIWPRKYLPTYIPIHLPTYPPTYLPASFTEHPQGAIPETCDLCDIWSEWWGDMTWPKKDNDKGKYKDNDNDKDKYIQSDEGTWPDQQKDKITKTKTRTKTNTMTLQYM